MSTMNIDHASWRVTRNGWSTMAVPASSRPARLVKCDIAVEEKASLWKTCVNADSQSCSGRGSNCIVQYGEADRHGEAAQRTRLPEASWCCRRMFTKAMAREKAHVAAVFRATIARACSTTTPSPMAPITCRSRLLNWREEHENFPAVKESSADARRMPWIREFIGDRLALFIGVDDAIVEAIAIGAIGWIAGLVNALPKESVLNCSITRRTASEKKHSRLFTSGSCRCCEWMRCRSSCN